MNRDPVLLNLLPIALFVSVAGAQTPVPQLSVTATDTFQVSMQLASGVLDEYREDGRQTRPNQILNVPIAVSTSSGSVDFTVQIAKQSSSWVGIVATCINIAAGGTPFNTVPAPPDTIYTVTAPAAASIPVTVDTSCITRLPVGIYRATIAIQSTPAGSAVDPPGIPIAITVQAGGIVTPPPGIVFGGSTTPQLVPIGVQNLGTDTYTFTIAYVPNPTIGTA